MADRTACVGFIGIRGASKTWTAQFVLEVLSERGWHPLIIDVKGEDETLHLPARDDQARSLSARGIKPKGFDTEYLTFNFPLAMENIPLRFKLEPISVKMLSFGHFRTLGGFLSPSEARELFDAYYSAGGPEAELEDILKALLRKKGPKVSSRLLALLTSGFFSDSSDLEPSSLIDIIGKYEFTVLSAAYFKPSVRDLSRFALNVVLDNLMGYLVQNLETARLVVHFRELREVAPRTGAMGSQWHLREKIEHFVTLLRQTRTSLTRVFYEVQNVKSIPKTLLDNTQAVFVHPFNLKEEAQRKELAKYFPIPQSVIHTIAPMTRMVPGKWIFLSKDGHAELVTAPPPRSLRMPEPKTPEDARRLAEIYSKLIPRRELKKELIEARKRYKFWKIRARELYGKDEMEVELGMELPPPTTLVISRPSRQISAILLSVHYNDGGDEIIPMIEISRWVGKTFGPTMQTYIAPTKLQKLLRNQKAVAHLRVAGVEIIQDVDGNYYGKIDRNRLRDHMAVHEELYLKRVGVAVVGSGDAR